MSALEDEMLANALESQKYTRKHLVVELDFSPHSVEELEGQFDAVEYGIPGGLSGENIALLTRIWGSYLGEVVRRHAGGQWVEENVEGERHVALLVSGEKLLPHEQVRRRLTEGDQHNTWTFFQQAIGKR